MLFLYRMWRTLKTWNKTSSCLLRHVLLCWVRIGETTAFLDVDINYFVVLFVIAIADRTLFNFVHLLLGKNVFSANRLVVLVERQVVVTATSLQVGCALLLATFFVFNINYPARHVATLEFLQRLVISFVLLLHIYCSAVEICCFRSIYYKMYSLNV
jgi:hypothetical protein